MDDREAGAAVVEYVLVSVLLVLVFLAIAQLALVIHARNVLTADAAEGARSAALRDSDLPTGERRCGEMVQHTLSHLVEATCTASYEGGAPRLVRVRATATVPLTVVPFGHVRLDVSARALVEP